MTFRSPTQMQSSDGQRREVVYTIDRGQRHKFVDLVIAGNKYFSREEIRERMGMQPAGGLLLYGLFSQSILAHDTQAIQNLYMNNGFLQVKVTANVKDDFEAEKDACRWRSIYGRAADHRGGSRH